MSRFDLASIFLPTTDRAVLVEAVVITVVMAVALYVTRRRPDGRLLVVGLWIMSYAIIALRALH